MKYRIVKEPGKLYRVDIKRGEEWRPISRRGGIVGFITRYGARFSAEYYIRRQIRLDNTPTYYEEVDIDK